MSPAYWPLRTGPDIQPAHGPTAFGVRPKAAVAYREVRRHGTSGYC